MTAPFQVVVYGTSIHRESGTYTARVEVENKHSAWVIRGKGETLRVPFSGGPTTIFIGDKVRYRASVGRSGHVPGQEERMTEGVPILSDLPILGRFFRYTKGHGSPVPPPQG